MHVWSGSSSSVDIGAIKAFKTQSFSKCLIRIFIVCFYDKSVFLFMTDQVLQ